MEEKAKITWKESLEKAINARCPIIYIETYDELLVDEEIEKHDSNRVIEWNEAYGVFLHNEMKSPLAGVLSNDLEVFLHELLFNLNVRSQVTNNIVILRDISEYIQRHTVKALLKAIAKEIEEGLFKTTIVIVSCFMDIPNDLENYIEPIESGFMVLDDIKAMVTNFCVDNRIVLETNTIIGKISDNLTGLTKLQILRALRMVTISDHKLDENDLTEIKKIKGDIVKNSGVLSYIDDKVEQDKIVGLRVLKDWLAIKAKIWKGLGNIDDEHSPIKWGIEESPRGVLILGMSGCGKSMTAKATATIFECPLLQLEMGKILGQYVGESEKNLRQAIKLAESISPCVLWIDEIEKAFAGESSNRSEVSTRLIGYLLTWMSEKKDRVFVVATANNIDNLEGELFRKGRFDKVFALMTPNLDERIKLFENALLSREKISIEVDQTKDDVVEDEQKKNQLKEKIKDICKRMDGFSGAEIAAVVEEVNETAFMNGKEKVSVQAYYDVIDEMQPFSKTPRGKAIKKKLEEGKFTNASMTEKDALNNPGKMGGATILEFLDNSFRDLGSECSYESYEEWDDNEIEKHHSKFDGNALAALIIESYNFTFYEKRIGIVCYKPTIHESIDYSKIKDVKINNNTKKIGQFIPTLTFIINEDKEKKVEMIFTDSKSKEAVNKLKSAVLAIKKKS